MQANKDKNKLITNTFRHDQGCISYYNFSNESLNSDDINFTEFFEVMSEKIIEEKKNSNEKIIFESSKLI